MIKGYDQENWKYWKFKNSDASWSIPEKCPVQEHKLILIFLYVPITADDNIVNRTNLQQWNFWQISSCNCPNRVSPSCSFTRLDVTEKRTMTSQLIQ